MANSPSSRDDGLLPADIDLGQIFIARDDQLDLFSFYLDRWLADLPASPESPKRAAPSPNERIQGLLVLLYGRGGFGKSTLLKRYHDMVLQYPQKMLVSEVIDWEFAIEGTRHLFQPATEQVVNADEYFRLLCDHLAHALGKQTNEFKEYQTAVRAVQEARQQVSRALERVKQDNRYAWLRTLASEELVAALRQFVPLSRPLLDNQTVAGVVKEGIDTGLKVTMESVGQLTMKLREKVGSKLDDYLDSAPRLGFALGQDLARWSRNFPLLIFFDTYEEVDEADTLLRLVMGAAGVRVGWVLAGRDNLWAGVGQRKRTQSKSYGYKEIATPGRAFSVDFNAGGVGAFTATDILEYFTQLMEHLPSGVSLPAVTEDDTRQIVEVTQGVPLAVKIAAGLYLETADVKLISQEGEGTREIVDELVQRYLLHTRDDQQERARLYGLALLRRPDYPVAVAAALGLSPEQAITDYERELSRLQRRYSFIFTEKAQPALHQEVRYFLRLWLLTHRAEPQILVINESLKQAHAAALNTLEEQRGYKGLKERLQDEEWVGHYLDLTEQQFWLDPGEGVRFCLPFFIAAAIYQHAITQEAARIGAFFAAQIKQPFRTWWEWAVHGLISAQDKNQLGKGFTELMELANLASQRSLAFPPPLPGLGTELEGALWWRLAEARLQKDDREALAWYEKALTRLSDDRDALAWYEKALTRLSQEEELKAAAARAYVKVGSLLSLRENTNEEALPFLDRAIELSPYDVVAYLCRGNVYENMKQYEQAFADHTQALTLDPNSTIAYVYRGNTYKRLQQYEQALADYAQALTLDPGDHGFDHAWAYIHRGHAYLNMKQYEQAIADYTQTISIDPDSAWSNINTWAYLHRGHAYLNMKQYEQAIADYTQTITLAPNAPEAYLHRGYAYLNLKKSEQACVDFARYAALKPRDVSAAWMVVYASLNKQRPGSELAERLEEIAALEPQGDEACVCRGVALGLRGKLHEGLAELEHALQLDAENEDALFWKGMVCAYLGRSTVAVESIKQAIQAGLSSVLLTPLYWLEQDTPQFFRDYAEPLLKLYEVN